MYERPRMGSHKEGSLDLICLVSAGVKGTNRLENLGIVRNITVG